MDEKEKNKLAEKLNRIGIVRLLRYTIGLIEKNKQQARWIVELEDENEKLRDELAEYLRHPPMAMGQARRRNRMREILAANPSEDEAT